MITQKAGMLADRWWLAEDQASLKGCGVPAVIASRQDCAMFAGGPFLGCAGGPLP